jgi:hypothetical protein
LLPLLLLCGVPAASGCYNPSIYNGLDGGFICGLLGACPEGFSCVSNHCHRAGGDGGTPSVDMKPDTPIDTFVDMVSVVPDGSIGPEVPACTPRTGITGCTPDSTPGCDPVCQTGCCTTEKCTTLNAGMEPNAVGQLGCIPNVPARALGETCDHTSAGTVKRSDNCSPGLICVDGNSASVCLKLCRTDADCGVGTNSKCETRPIEVPTGSFKAKVCGLPPTPCDPTLGLGSGCPPARVCYLVTSDKAAGDTTICEFTSGEIRNMACTYSRECLAGSTCATAGMGAGYCRPVCSHAATPPNICPGISMCQTDGKVFDHCY